VLFWNLAAKNKQGKFHVMYFKRNTCKWDCV